MTAKYKILSLDGGGIRGVLSAKILQQIEKTLWNKKQQRLHEYFDLIAGTSTGSILAAGIACQMDADQLIDFYIDFGKDIFLWDVRWQRKYRLLSRFIGNHALYPHERGENKGLANVLKKNLKFKSEPPENSTIIETPKISEIPSPHLLILAYDVLSRNTTWFSNNSPEDPREWYDDIELWKICTASASAPTFFPPYKLYHPKKKEDLTHIDGGVSANNPALSAIAHALLIEKEKRQLKLSDIAVLSIGTGQTTRPFTYEEVKKWGQFGWIRNLPDIFLNPSAQNSEAICKQLINSIGGAHLRLDFQLNERVEGSKQLKDDQKQEISEQIDDPTICSDLIDAAKGYLNFGKVNYRGEKFIVLDGIQQFIEEN